MPGCPLYHYAMVSHHSRPQSTNDGDNSHQLGSEPHWPLCGKSTYSRPFPPPLLTKSPSKWSMNNSSFRGDYNAPILLLSNLGNNSYPDSPDWNVYDFGSNSSVRIVIENPGFLAHPMHLHGVRIIPPRTAYPSLDVTDHLYYIAQHVRPRRRHRILGRLHYRQPQ